jgi:hypothetical protein
LSNKPRIGVKVRQHQLLISTLSLLYTLTHKWPGFFSSLRSTSPFLNKEESPESVVNSPVVLKQMHLTQPYSTDFKTTSPSFLLISKTSRGVRMLPVALFYILPDSDFILDLSGVLQ